VLLLKVYDKSGTKDLTPSEESAIRKMAGEIRKQKAKGIKKDQGMVQKKRTGKSR
jgi:hypothetical protein